MKIRLYIPKFHGMRRFWTMLAHYHGQTWNGSEQGRALGVSDKTVARLARYSRRDLYGLSTSPLACEYRQPKTAVSVKPT